MKLIFYVVAVLVIIYFVKNKKPIPVNKDVMKIILTIVLTFVKPIIPYCIFAEKIMISKTNEIEHTIILSTPGKISLGVVEVLLIALWIYMILNICRKYRQK